jgi:hypothetical protein
MIDMAVRIDPGSGAEKGEKRKTRINSEGERGQDRGERSGREIRNHMTAFLESS